MRVKPLKILLIESKRTVEVKNIKQLDNYKRQQFQMAKVEYLNISE